VINVKQAGGRAGGRAGRLLIFNNFETNCKLGARLCRLFEVSHKWGENIHYLKGEDSDKFVVTIGEEMEYKESATGHV
jgi:hypothetical protein